jgi:hypothetical protein
MQLNETTARIDGALDAVCKKIEKIEADTRGDQESGNLTYRPNYAGAGTPYAQYIRDFRWESLRYPTKRSLNELAITIQKQMHQKDEQIRKNMEEFTGIRQRIQAMTKKDTGNLQVRDFTDDIYKQNLPADGFVEHFNSELFANLLFVVQNERAQAFHDLLPVLMERYYEVVDAADRKRVRDAAKQKFTEIALNHKKFVLARDKLAEEGKAAAAEEAKRPMIEEEKKSEAMAKLQTWEDQYSELLANRR